MQAMADSLRNRSGAHLRYSSGENNQPREAGPWVWKAGFF